MVGSKAENLDDCSAEMTVACSAGWKVVQWGVMMVDLMVVSMVASSVGQWEQMLAVSWAISMAAMTAASSVGCLVDMSV